MVLKFIKFEKSKAKHKKYAAILKNTETGRTKKVNFGDKRYQHYRDKTGLGLYSHLDHRDPERRRRYRLRHGKTMRKKYSASYFAAKYLW
jgi:hypothetical protein